MERIPPERIRLLRDDPVREDGRYVLYWMIAQRRLRHSFALDRACLLAKELGKPLLVFEPLRCAYEHASERLHRFVLEGMAEHAETLERRGVRYLPYVEPEPDAGKGLLKALAAEACAVVTDEYPCFHVPAMLAAAARQIDARLEAVDGCGLLPLHEPEKQHKTAHALRAHMQKVLPPHLERVPMTDPLRGLPEDRAVVPRAVLDGWDLSPDLSPDGLDALLRDLPIDHEVRAVEMVGGSTPGRERLKTFVTRRMASYADGRNQPDEETTSGLSPYLHFGHVGVHEVFAAVAAQEDWSPEDLGSDTRGKRSGWWGMCEGAEAFLDQCVTWRELGHHTCVQLPADYDKLTSLPDWAQATLAKHAADERPHRYELEAFERAETHDEIWNAAQRELVRTGAMHNYLRMLWGKKILEWTSTPDEALAVMIHLNDKYAVDGRDPNSYSGILWVLGRHDRPWGPERPIFGTVRFMSSDSTRRKLRIQPYLDRFGRDGGGTLFE